ncbi:hypothetical protein CHLRE_03g165976v5 [Chlamydomonas reinhardtii]|uniref:Uncharacterized protein n=1 Tax=Chlamydomonas reinhardtii TaxID=3055 RepID=A0A2K3DWQ3_CHLRE|nr:uncharacterized protein CHLRE_03g165976v5 [Chlamydomonas reinhardtii]PNW84965.1 hypothetical protein CHLRE_03g165976v5 [Chlamydomonas reinhardtii]
MDPEQSREQLRTVLRTCGADLTLFEDSDLDIMLGVRFRSGRALQGATREGLTASGLPPGLVDHILTLKGAAAGPDSGSSAAAAHPARAQLSAA